MQSLKSTGVKIDITDDGAVSICGVDQAGMDKAMKYIKNYRSMNSKKDRYMKVRL